MASTILKTNQSKNIKIGQNESKVGLMKKEFCANYFVKKVRKFRFKKVMQRIGRKSFQAQSICNI
jgi:hypothetical protein